VKKKTWWWLLIGGAGLGLYLAKRKKEDAEVAAAVNEATAEAGQAAQGDYLRIGY
jgi:hypothetical protein